MSATELQTVDVPFLDLDNARIAVIGLGYVGLPLAVELGKRRPVTGFDIRTRRIEELSAGRDDTLEVEPNELRKAEQLVFTSETEALRDCGIFIVTVPTPIDRANRPDLTALYKATETVARAMPKGAVVIYESTVFPGCTRDLCVPILEQISGLMFNRDFFVGYSPERINPGDKEHRLTTITKVTSGSTPEAADAIDRLYAQIVTAGTHKARSIEVAEAAKVIENTQRDLNIAFVNDLAILFNRLGIDTMDVLEAAGTKWNFLPFRPGLVGGHCIGVDPYYLTHKAQEVGHHSDIILAGRRTNDSIGSYIAGQTMRLMIRKGINPVKARVLILGLAFKENCPDLRNSRVVDIVHALREDNVQVDVHDPWVNAGEALHEYGLNLVARPQSGSYNAIIVAVGHDQFRKLGTDGIRAFGRPDSVIYDVKCVLPREAVDARL